MTAYPALCLDGRGRCPNCLRKPLAYKKDSHWFCSACCRAYRMMDGQQIKNWAWRPCGEGFVPYYLPNSESNAGQYALAKPTAAAIRRAAQRS